MNMDQNKKNVNKNKFTYVNIHNNDKYVEVKEHKFKV